jgi:hypothetical protein
MAKKLIPFPTKPPAREPKAPTRSYARLILTIGDRRFAVELFGRVTELSPTPARILMFNRPKDKKPPKSCD